MYGSYRNATLDEGPVNVQHDGDANLSWTHTFLCHLERKTAVGITCQIAFTILILASVQHKRKVLEPCQVLVSNELSENLEDRLLIQHDFLSSIAFFPRINHLYIALCNAFHQLLMHVMIYALRVKVWVMQNFLDKVLELFCSSLIIFHMRLYYMFAGREHAGIVDVQKGEQPQL
jgi:hypothetical protein